MDKEITLGFDSGMPLIKPECTVTLTISPHRRCVPLRLVSSCGDDFYLKAVTVGVESLLSSCGGQSIWAVPPFELVKPDWWPSNVRFSAVRSNIPDLPPVVCEVGNDISLTVTNTSKESKRFTAVVVARRLDFGEPAEGWFEPAELVPGDVVERRHVNHYGGFSPYGIVDHLEGPWAHVRFPNVEKPEAIDLRALRKVDAPAKPVLFQASAGVHETSEENYAQELPQGSYRTTSAEDIVNAALEDVPEAFTKGQWKAHLLAMHEAAGDRPQLLADLVALVRKAPWLMPPRGAAK